MISVAKKYRLIFLLFFVLLLSFGFFFYFNQSSDQKATSIQVLSLEVPKGEVPIRDISVSPSGTFITYVKAGGDRNPEIVLFNSETNQSFDVKLPPAFSEGKGDIIKPGCWETDELVYFTGSFSSYLYSLDTQSDDLTLAWHQNRPEDKKYYGECLKPTTPEHSTIVGINQTNDNKVEVINKKTGETIDSYSTSIGRDRVAVNNVNVSPNLKYAVYTVEKYSGAWVSSPQGYLIHLDQQDAKPIYLGDAVYETWWAGEGDNVTLFGKIDGTIVKWVLE